ncbi:MAG: S1 RNA-binding domain-containing protein, partial [Synergistaceae bacterium]
MVEKTSAASAVNIGDVLSGTVEHLAPYGAFVRLESGQKAMVHISELSHNYVKKVEDVLEMGQKVTAKVIKIDEKGRIDLSIKATQVKEVRPPVHKEEDFEK